MKQHTVTVELPRLRVPAALMIDDTSLQLDGFYAYLDELQKLVDAFGVKGKMSITPWVNGKGPLDDLKNPPLTRSKFKTFLKAAERLSRVFDMTPEMITHGPTLSLKTGALMDISEWEWSRSQTVPVLARYLSRAISMIANTGIATNGFTSPVDFGQGNEKRVARAVLAAEEKVNRRSVGWIFMSNDENSAAPLPEVYYLSRDRKKIAMDVTSCLRDLLLFEAVDHNGIRASQINRLADEHINRNGTRGRLVQVIENGGYCAVHTHWWALYDHGSLNGFKVYRKILSRLNTHFADRITWMKCSDMARYRAAQVTAKFRVARHPRGVRVTAESGFDCPDFTFSVTGMKSAGRITAGSTVLKQVDAKKDLDTGTWYREGSKVHICCPVFKGRAKWVTIITV